ncbi:MAG: type II methionyl aminopeptidase [archaeon]
MEPHVIEHYQDAAKVHALCRKKAVEMIQPGIKLVDIAETIESLTQKHGCGIAFPLNLSLNDIAAHYTPSAGDEQVVEEGDVLKVDIGVHKEGYIIDAAITLDFARTTETKNLVTATQAALEAGFSKVREGVEVRELGAAIADTLQSFGVDPVENLSGHGLEQYVAHCAPTIPNVDSGETDTLEGGFAYAMEPFGSIHGNGRIVDAGHVEIFEVVETPGMVRNPHARKILEFCTENYDSLPFAERWLVRDMEMSDFSRKIGLRELVKYGALEAHPVLREKKGAIVAQFETTMLINKGKVLRLV